MVEQLPAGSEIDISEEIRLWRAFQEEDMAAYEQIFRLYYRDLYGYGLKLCSRPELVRDSIQTLFVALWEQKSNLSEVRSVKAYLLASIRRHILKTLRRKRMVHVMHNSDDYSLTMQTSVEDRIIESELKTYQKAALREALKCLSERQREILILKYYNGLSYREIEELLCINYQSVRNHIYRSLQKLREQLVNAG